LFSFTELADLLWFAWFTLSSVILAVMSVQVMRAR
jgi:hypothetical protein